ncbi:hypothetical protein EUX98_g6527 [Antrodiella citrinella]|uniref:Uncharacterized protein n=1 Tax=Antrodiella citrinella TaxID=2447956 RepID=A0A4S4MP25_9APHY|nr:hypothetical protein EUX98_g6527 [Antrodiella citrinella]
MCGCLTDSAATLVLPVPDEYRANHDIRDARFAKTRFAQFIPPPWSLSIERAAVSTEASLATLEDYNLFKKAPPSYPEAVLWEVYMQRTAQSRPDVPRLLVHGHVAWPDGRAIHPPAVVIQYVPDKTPVIFAKGRSIRLRTRDGRIAEYHIVKPFLPFTKSVVLLAESQPRRERVILKIFDPRFLNDRDPPLVSAFTRPWTLVVEQAAVCARPNLAHMSTRALSSLFYKRQPDDIDELAQRDAMFEEFFYRRLTHTFTQECSAYQRLHDLQGSVIPRLITSGNMVTQSDERAIVLEFIHGKTLGEMTTDELGAYMPALKAVVQLVDSFGHRGVVHGDLTLGNLLFTPPTRGQPLRVVVIDFGCTVVREATVGDEQWWDYVESSGDLKGLRVIFKHKGLPISDLDL